MALRVGGDFFYDPATQGDQDLLLIAGGVGINPLYSIINNVIDINVKGDHSDDPTSNLSRQRVMLLYSAKTVEELIFKVRGYESFRSDLTDFGIISMSLHGTKHK